jgi:hypothetical protein
MPRFDVWVAAKSEILYIEDDDENEDEDDRRCHEVAGEGLVREVWTGC